MAFIMLLNAMLTGAVRAEENNEAQFTYDDILLCIAIAKKDEETFDVSLDAVRRRPSTSRGSLEVQETPRH